MKKLGLIGLIIISLFGFRISDLDLTCPAEAQHVYLGMYWIGAFVDDPSHQGTAGRQACFFKEPLANNKIVGPYSDDDIGPAGLSGRENECMFNAFEDWRMIVAPGKYFAAIPNDNISNPAEGWGADLVEVDLTGRGYDIAPNLVLAKGAGPLPPDDRPSPYAPSFEDIRFGTRKYQPTLVAKGQDFIISNQPQVKAKAVSAFGVDVNRIFMVLNADQANSQTFTVKSSHVVQSLGPADAPTEVTFLYDFSNEKETLPEGEQTFTFKASNAYGTGTYDCLVTVAGGEPRLIGTPITFPSPIHLKTDKEVFFQYTLSHDINVSLYLFDVSGRIVRKMDFLARQEGGAAGVNKVSWNLITDQGSLVSSGIYVFTLVNRDDNKLLGKGKFTALP